MSHIEEFREAVDEIKAAAQKLMYLLPISMAEKKADCIAMAFNIWEKTRPAPAIPPELAMMLAGGHIPERRHMHGISADAPGTLPPQLKCPEDA